MSRLKLGVGEAFPLTRTGECRKGFEQEAFDIMMNASLYKKPIFQRCSAHRIYRLQENYLHRTRVSQSIPSCSHRIPTALQQSRNKHLWTYYKFMSGNIDSKEFMKSMIGKGFIGCNDLDNVKDKLVSMFC